MRLTASLTSASVGHYAVGAEVVAPTHNTDETAHLAATHSLGNDVAVGFGLGEFGVNGFVAVLGFSDEHGQVQVRVGAGHKVHIVFAD